MAFRYPERERRVNERSELVQHVEFMIDKKKSIKILGVSSIFLLASCVPQPTVTPEKYDTTVSSWKGAQAQALIGTFGYPKKIQKLPNGDHDYIYEVLYQPTLLQPPTPDAVEEAGVPSTSTTQSQIIVPPKLPPGHKFELADMDDSGAVIVKLPPHGPRSAFPLLTDADGNPVKMYCNVAFEVNSDNEVTDVQSQGNYCLGTDEFVSTFANPDAQVTS